jgi:hypothetical protein
MSQEVASKRCEALLFHDLFSETIVDGEDLKNPHTPSISILAVGTSRSFGSTPVAATPNQSLGDNPIEPSRHQIGGHTHLKEANHGSRGISAV